MQVYKRRCREAYTVRDDEGTVFTVQAGRDYTTSSISDDGTVVVFSQYWVRVPARIFKGGGRMVIFEPDDPLVYDVEGYRPGERTRIAIIGSADIRCL